MDATKTNSFLDAAGFSDMISAHKRGKVRKLKDYIEYCVLVMLIKTVFQFSLTILWKKELLERRASGLE